MLRFCLATVAAASVAVTAAACGGGTTDPSKNRMDDIADVLDPQTQNVYAFTAAKNGEYSITLTALSNPNVTIGIGSGRLLTTTDCVIGTGQQNNLVKLNAVALSGTINKGNDYCFIVYDNGTLAASVNYTVRLSHP